MSIETKDRPLTGAMDVTQFLKFLEPRPHTERWDLIDGRALMMTPPTHVHQVIADNFKTLLGDAFRASGLQLRALLEIGIRNPDRTDFMPRPDVAVLPLPIDYDLYRFDYRLAAEVLSPSNTRREIGRKLLRYREARDCLYVVVIDSRKIALDIYARSRSWEPLSLTSAEARIDMPEFGLSCAAGEFYRGTPLDPLHA